MVEAAAANGWIDREAAILETLSRQVDFRSAQQIHEQMRADGETVGLATVYRTLQNLAGEGTVDVLRTAQPEIMRAAQKGIVHKNTASRKMSRLSKRVAGL